MGHSGELPPSDAEASSTVGVPSLLSEAGVAVVQVGASGEVRAANDGFAELTGHAAEAVRGTALAEFLQSVPEPLESLLADPQGGESVTLTLPVTTADGEVVGCEAHFEGVAADGDPAIAGVLYQSEAQSAHPGDERDGGAPSPANEVAPARAFVALAEALSEGIIVLDTDSQIQYANAAVERILGHRPEELVGGSKLSIIPERLRETHLTALNRYLETGTRNIDWEYVELPGQHKDGHEVPLGISLNDFWFDGDRYFVGLFRDVSAQKEAERALRERERQLEEYQEYTDDILNAIDDVFYVLDADGNLRRWNDTLREVSGYADEEIASMRSVEFFPEDERETIANAIETGFETGSTREEAHIRTKDGEEIPYEIVAAALEDPDGEPVLAGIGRDVTAQKEQQRKLEESNERLEQFAYAASHDLQEPLRMVTSYLQLIDRRHSDDLDEEAEEFLEFAVDGAERMREMIEGLLAYSRVDTKGKPLEPVDLDAVLDEVTDDLRLRIEESDARVRVEDLPRVSGDRGQLRQVFQNLVSNAIEYSGDEPPVIDVTAERDGEMWRLSVRDEGIGIDPEDTDRIFRVFQRLHSYEDHAGTGIGLALCRRIVERHGGEIWAESNDDGGATFSFTLPPAGDER